MLIRPTGVLSPTSPLKVTLPVPAEMVRFCAPSTLLAKDTSPLAVTVFTVTSPSRTRSPLNKCTKPLVVMVVVLALIALAAPISIQAPVVMLAPLLILMSLVAVS